MTPDASCFSCSNAGKPVGDASRQKSEPHRRCGEGRRAPRTACQREALARQCSCGHCSFRTLRARHASFLTLPRGNALGDALCHESTRRCRDRGGCRAAGQRRALPSERLRFFTIKPLPGESCAA
ncbi:DUF1534 domain-containing protein [Pseudomonas caricapapayae]|nr:DUF1534 domain-containing protein [Pseudomonas caricapapayae]